MVRPEVAGARIARASSWLDDSYAIFSQHPAAFAAAVKDRDLAVFYFYLALQEGIDLAAHWVADAGWGSPDDAGSTFDLLADRQAIPRDMAEGLRQGLGLRNRIAHGYALLDYPRVQVEALAGIPMLRGFLSAVAGEAGL